jgi:chromosome segregation ATPase
MENSSASLLEVSREWKQKADQALKQSMAELSSAPDRQAAKTRRTATRAAELTSARMTSNLATLAREVEENQDNRQKWVKTQIDDLHDQTRYEIESMDTLRQQQQQTFQAQLTEKNEFWEKAVLERREEAAQLRSMISHLSSAISVARNEAKADIDEARRRASESAKVIRSSREKQIQQIADLTTQIQKERTAFEIEVKQVNAASANATQQKKDDIARFEGNLGSLKTKLKEKEKVNETKFRQQYRIIRELRAQLQQVREAENQQQEELMTMRKTCTSVSRKISARKNEAASIKRQLALIEKDNHELQSEIVKLEAQLFPQVFNPSRL